MIRATVWAMLLAPASLAAQQALSRTDAIRLALGATSRIAAIAADTLAAAARARAAREYPNPTLNASYSKAAPQTHFIMDVPLDLPSIRGARVRAAQAAQLSARYTFLANRAAIELDADTLYTAAQGAALRASLSRATAADAATLLSATRARRDAGDASDLDVNLAQVSADQTANTAAADSIESVNAVLELQTAIGLPGDSVMVALDDSIGIPTSAALVGASAAPRGGLASAPTVAAATASLTAAQQTLIFQRRSVLGVPALTLGVEARDPTGSENGLLPTFGVALPIPLFSRNRGEIEAARADVTRAEAELTTVQREAASALARAYRTRSAAEQRVARDRAILAAATSNAALSEQAYTQGEMAMADVLEARRAQREAQSQYVSDLVAVNVGAALVRVLTTNGATP